MAVRISKRESFRATCASLGVPRSNNDFPARNFRGYACFGYAYLFNSTLEIGVIRVYICIYSPIISPSVVFVLTIVSLSLSLFRRRLDLSRRGVNRISMLLTR